MIKHTYLLILATVLLMAGCKKDRGFYEYENQLKSYNGSLLEFLQEQNQYDSFLVAVQRVGLEDSLRTGIYTVFAPSNASFMQAVDNLNTLRKTQERPLMFIHTVPEDQLDSLVCRYIVRGIVPADSMLLQDGLILPAVRYGYPMHGKLNYTNAEGHVKGGPGVIRFSDTKGVIYTNRWSGANTMAIDIRTTNGMVNILDKDHMFGFDEFIRRMNPTTSSPWNEFPFFVPGIIPFEQFDRGGARVAYHDFSMNNAGGQYRPAEYVDITNAEENGMKVGWTDTDEWMKYTVDITETGAYEVILRYGSPGSNGKIHLEIDDKFVVGSQFVLPTTGAYSTFRDIRLTMTFPAGRHVLKVYYDFANFDIRFLKIIPKDRPYPIPGLISMEDFMPGGEGVGYHDNNTGNNGGKYRPDEGVDIDLTRGSGGGYHVGWTENNEWMNYSVDVKEAGLYDMYVTAGSPNNGCRFRLEFDGQNATGSVNIPNTGDYANLKTFKSSVFLQKGPQVMRFFVEQSGYDIKQIAFRRLN